MKTQRAFVLFISLLGLVLIEHVWLAQFAHPMGDDWSYAYQGIERDLLPWLKGEYLHWNGRFFSNLLVVKGPLVLGVDQLWLYRLMPVALMLITVMALVALVRSLTGTAISGWQQCAGGLILFALYIHAMPDIGEGFYWYTGAITYQFASALSFFYLASLHRLLTATPQGGQAARNALNVLLLAMIIGSSEVHMLLMLTLHFFVFLIRWKMKKVHAPVLVTMSAVVVFSLVMLLAPGNEVRGAHFPHRHDLLNSIWMSTLQTGRFLFNWASSLSLLLLSVLYIPISRELSRRVPIFQRSFHLTPAMSAALLLTTIFICVFPAYWSTGILGQHRTVNVAHFFFLPLWFINLTVWTNSRHGQWIRRDWPTWIPTTLLLIALLDLSLTRNSGRANGDLFTGRAARFDAQMEKRYALLTATPTGNDPVVLEKITDPPQSLYLLEIRDDPDDWVNRAYALYFGLEGRKIATASGN